MLRCIREAVITLLLWVDAYIPDDINDVLADW